MLTWSSCDWDLMADVVQLFASAMLECASSACSGVCTCAAKSVCARPCAPWAQVVSIETRRKKAVGER